MTLDPVNDLFRHYDHDRFLAHLFLPEAVRADVAALHAFASETARIRELVHEPMVGEIRLAFWRDLLTGEGHGDARAHPVASAILQLIERRNLPVAPLLAMIEARQFDLYDDPMPDLHTLEGYLGETASALFSLTCQILDPQAAPLAADACGHAGVAWGMAGLLRALPIQSARGQCYIPADVLARHGADPAEIRKRDATPAVLSALAEMREHVRHHHDRALRAIAALPPSLKPAFVVLGLLPACLGRLDANARPFQSIVDLPQWQKPLILWWKARG